MRPSRPARHATAKPTPAAGWARALRRLCFAALVIASAALAADAPSASPTTPNEITVVLDDNYPPYIFRDRQGTLQGYLVDSWMLWSKKTGTPVQLLASDWNLAQQRMQRHQADVIDTMFENDERLKTHDFGPPYADVPVSIYSHRGIGGIASIETLRGLLVGVKDGDACVNTLNAQGINSLQAYPSYEALVQSAIRGEIRVFCLDEPPANYLLYRENAEQDFRRAFRLYSGEFHRAYHKGDSAMRTRIEAGFAAFSPQEKQALAEKWMGQPLQASDLPPAVLYALDGLAGAGILLIVWVVSLRRAVRQRTEELIATLEAIPDPMFECDPRGYCHQSFAATPTGHTAVSPINRLDGRKVDAVLPPDAATIWLNALKEAERRGRAGGFEIELDAPGEKRWIELSVARKGHRTGSDARFVVIARDITARREAEAAIRQLAHHDPLTGLPNRTVLDDRLRAAISRARRQRGQFAVLFLDIDRFKRVNDTLGHSAGDQLLIEFAQRLRAILREEDTLSRLGGDEFILVLPDTDAAGAASVAEKIIASISTPFMIDAQELACTTSIGIALYPDDGESLETLSMHADTAMYRAKSAGRNRPTFFGDPPIENK
ncbi:diguanylate cyclase domain-containing protein [Propionivibrio dicarboxylicus]|uniref:PAS domain S-box-containing protein/diguanylate cyclase (GGDEF) domain-containing protein n=1 Tax=Propionivibrio dicarboxylicus TaxID=83767 RepID=A0A1G8C047_9RHOO|nr:diguanylate cyclase [Propionivibrio dicarboxylicus]SDH38847.1 PAS domain S-box-containing protein/diguanylate cyclase (GGDEF) domain-containing protein [Propionivibrio dicarboxylicus]